MAVISAEGRILHRLILRDVGGTEAWARLEIKCKAVLLAD